MTTLIKTCGMFRREDIAAVNEACPDFVGFVVNFPASHRSVSPEKLKALRNELRSGIKAVGVFVDEDPRLIVGLVREGVIDVVQLHGHEDEAYLADLRERCDVPLFQAFKVRTPQDVERARVSSADVVVLDNGFGTGERFDWDMAQTIDRSYLLAGGLTPENIPEAIALLHPWAVDLSSGLESGGVKDPAKIAAAVAAARDFE